MLHAAAHPLPTWNTRWFNQNGAVNESLQLICGTSSKAGNLTKMTIRLYIRTSRRQGMGRKISTATSVKKEQGTVDNGIF